MSVIWSLRSAQGSTSTMAPVVAAVVPPPPTPKIKRPPPPGIQTNGVSSLQSSPSPNMTAKRPPPAVTKQQQQQQQHTSNSSATNGANGTAHRPGVARSRRDTSNQVQGRNQRNNASLRSATLAPDTSLHRSFEPRPDGAYSIAIVHSCI